MKYTVLWSPIAERGLAQLWLLDENQADISNAANHLDTLLRRSPSAVGESRAEGTRIAFEPPLAVLFEVREEDRTVVVLRIWGVERQADVS